MARVPTTTTNPNEIAALRIKDQWRETIESIRADRDLSKEGRLRRIAGAYLTTVAELDAVDNSDRRQATDRRASLVRSLFGSTPLNGSDVISFRDAHDRVAALSGDDEDAALHLLEQAELSGDTYLAKAIAQRGITEVWVRVLNAYAEAHPGTESSLQELLDITLTETGSGRSEALARDIARRSAFDLEVPVELTGWSDFDIRAAASGGPVERFALAESLAANGLAIPTTR